MPSLPFQTSLTVASSTRVTKTGRTIRYDLTVIQQPERARACGSGAKASADRRPVDPPPVVELRIFEKILENWEDITFAYGANFFLFATLEAARPMARGRAQQPSTSPPPPVLTGMPVSGMAYLDRPKEAGYFIFPDLSVRHEGQYILSFNLYEETRPDAEMDVRDTTSMTCVMSPDATFDWRLEIKSELFTVYSAKKFPGLAESTSLSRTVAEQGCRVRIRRDVRMRRREDKGNGDVDAQAEDFRPCRPVEQEAFPPRSRSNSGSPDGRPEFQTGPRPGSLSPLLPNTENRAGRHLEFMGERAVANAHWATPGLVGPPQGQQFAPLPTQFQNHGLQYPQYGHPHVTSHQGYGDRIYPHSAVEQHEREVYENHDPRRASIASHQPTYPSQHDPSQAVAENCHRQPYASSTPALPPLPSLRLDKLDSIAPSGPLTPINVAPLRSPTNERYERSAQASYQYLGSQLAPAPEPQTPSLPAEPMRIGMKRAHDRVFSSSATTRPLHNGMRPGSSYVEKSIVDEDDDEPDYPGNMTYRRADGSDIRRCLPNVS